MKRAALLATAALLMAPLAHAQQVTNDQYQLRGVTAETTVEVDDAGDVGATSVASGNAVSTSHDQTDADIDNTQHMDGDTSAVTDATVWHADGVIAVASAAVANGATAVATDGDQDIESAQLAHGDVSAETTFVGGDASDASSSASASGNVLAASQENGQTRVIAAQESTGDVSATVEADHCCVGGQVVSAAISSANNVSAGGDTGTILADVDQTATGDSVNARVDLYAGYATDASGNSTANGNAVTIDNQWGYVNAAIDQGSSADVTAESYVTLGGDFLGFASAGAYGVGNQAIVSNVGSDTVMDVSQGNSGDISASAALAGEGGDAALASSAAYGNNISGSLCAYCDDSVPTLTATSDQTNDGSVHADATVIAPRAGVVAATATAIGNAATYQVRGPGGR